MVNINLVLPSNFLDEEIRYGYKVTRKMKEVWAVELDLLNEFIKVCNKYHLTYYAMSGTLLGTVRHSGFIPWDDDIDVIMPRKDYDILLKIGPREFNNPYFFQCPLTEKNFWRSHVQIRNSQTTAISKNDTNLEYNKGIFMDVFPLDKVPDNIEKRDAHRRKLKKCMGISYYEMHKSSEYTHDQSFKQKIKEILIHVRMLCNDHKKRFIQFNKICSKFQNSNTKKVAQATLSYREVAVWNAIDFTKSETHRFEFLNIKIPSGYNEILTTQYGKEYMAIPKQYPNSAHGKMFFDTNKSYKEHKNILLTN